MVVPSPLGWEPIAARPRALWRWALGAIALVIAAVITLNVVSVPYFALLPGKALAVNGSGAPVTIKAAHKGSGDVFLATVLLSTHVTLWDRVFAFSHPDTQLIKKTDLTGGASPAQFAQQNAQEMTDSQLFAKVAALRRLGYAVPEHGDGALILQVQPGSPADGPLKAGDVVKKVDGKVIGLASDATVAIRGHKPGDLVVLQIARPGSSPQTTDVTVRPIQCGAQLCPSDPRRPLIGVGLATDKDHFDLPLQVGLSIATDNIGGPSAGLAFALGAIDALTTSRLTGGHRVAVTGTIDADGNVGPVGGVQQKTVAVENAGCEYFLVPPDEFAAASAKARGHHLTVAKVATLDDALRFLKTIGGDESGIPAKSPLPTA
jgi:PDZ domain-containing protein